jgi:hypothetical protein
MSTALAIAGVTAVLRDLLNDMVINHEIAGISGNTVLVTALPPDRIAPNGAADPTQLNVFLRHVTPNLGWQNVNLPSRDAAGRSRLANPPLALDLHYLISAHGAAELHAEILLGYVMQLLHENPVISRDAIRAALANPSGLGTVLPAALQSLAGSGLEDQVEQLKITPEYLSTEDMSKFWTSTLAHYRPCAAYSVSVVLIQARNPARSPLPVLERRLPVEPSAVPAVPTIESITPLDGLPVATIGSRTKLEGHHLGQSTGRKVLLENDRFDVRHLVDAVDGVGGPERLEFVIPTGSAGALPAGVYRVSVLLPSGTRRESNRLALTLAPKITKLPDDPVPAPGDLAAFDVEFVPPLQQGQSARLIVGQIECAPNAFTVPIGKLRFAVPGARPGTYPVRLRIDGIESPIVEFVQGVPQFNDRRVVIA